MQVSTLFHSDHRYTAHSDVTPINVGRIGRRAARHILANPEETLEERFKVDFPGMEVPNDMPPLSHVYAPIVTQGTQLYKVASVLYKQVLHGDRWLDKFTACRFLLALLHLNGLLHLTADSTSCLWWESLRTNTIILLIDTGMLDYLFQS